MSFPCFGRILIHLILVQLILWIRETSVNERSEGTRCPDVFLPICFGPLRAPFCSPGLLWTPFGSGNPWHARHELSCLALCGISSYRSLLTAKIMFLSDSRGGILSAGREETSGQQQCSDNRYFRAVETPVSLFHPFHSTFLFTLKHNHCVEF